MDDEIPAAASEDEPADEARPANGEPERDGAAERVAEHVGVA